jgi:hypothetical protein
MTDILDRLKDLHIQATKERSHYYTGSCIRDAIAEISMLRALCETNGIRWDELNMQTMAAALVLMREEPRSPGKPRKGRKK